MLFASCILRSGSGSKSRILHEPEECGLHAYSQVSSGQPMGMVRSEPQGTLPSGLFCWKESEERP